MPFQRTKLVRFGHCDPAGIVFYPRYVEMCHEVFEDWLREGVGVPLDELLGPRRSGIPAVRLEAEFLAPSRHGDALAFHLWVSDIGNSSITLNLSAECAGRTRMVARIKVVLMSLDTGRAVPIDDAWRARLAPFVIEPASP